MLVVQMPWYSIVVRDGSVMYLNKLLDFSGFIWGNLETWRLSVMYFIT